MDTTIAVAYAVIKGGIKSWRSVIKVLMKNSLEGWVCSNHTFVHTVTI